MVLPSGESQLSFSQIRAEFGTDNVKWVLDSEEPSGFKAEGTSGDNANGPVRLGQYRRDDPSFTNENIGDLTGLPLDAGVYTSGTMTVDVFHGKKLNTVVDLHSSGNANYGLDARTDRFDNGNYTIVGGYRSSVAPSTWQGGKKIIIHVNDTFSSNGAYYLDDCAVLGGTWPSNTDSRMDFGDECVIAGKGGNGGTGGRDTGSPGGTGGYWGSTALGLHNDTDVGLVFDDAKILGGGGGGGGGKGASQDDWGDHNEAGGGGGGGGAGSPAGDGGSGKEGGGDGGEGTLQEGGGGGAGGDRGEAEATDGGDGGDNAEDGDDGSNSGGVNTRGSVGEGGTGGYQLIRYGS